MNRRASQRKAGRAIATEVLDLEAGAPSPAGSVGLKFYDNHRVPRGSRLIWQIHYA